jgi:hypothetical protein
VDEASWLVDGRGMPYHGLWGGGLKKPIYNACQNTVSYRMPMEQNDLACAPSLFLPILYCVEPVPFPHLHITNPIIL